MEPGHSLIDGAALDKLVLAAAVEAAFSPHTLRAYASSVRAYGNWCAERSVSPLPVTGAQLALWLAYAAENKAKPATLTRHVAALKWLHRMKNLPFPENEPGWQLALRGLKRAQGTAPAMKAPLTLPLLKRVLAAIPATHPRDIRDRALLMLGFAGALRRSELANLRFEHIAREEAGLILTLPRSKTDALGAGQKVALRLGSHAETCPAAALTAWAKCRGNPKKGPVFVAVSSKGMLREAALTDREIARIVKRRLEGAGLESERYSGHSLRAGLITTAAREGVPDYLIMKQSRHKSLEMLKRYTRDFELLKDNVTGLIGL